MITLIQTLQILVSLAFVAFVIIAGLGGVHLVNQGRFPRWSERIRRRLAGPGDDAKVDG